MANANNKKPNNANVETTTNANAKLTKADVLKIISLPTIAKGEKNLREGAMLYKSELFAGCETALDKKHLRIKLRRNRDKFVQKFVMHKKNAEFLKELAKEWHKYATNIYVDTTKIIDNNGKDENIAPCIEFVNAMEKNK